MDCNTTPDIERATPAIIAATARGILKFHIIDLECVNSVGIPSIVRVISKIVRSAFPTEREYRNIPPVNNIEMRIKETFLPM
jgi:hypothetical protein